MYNSYKNRKNRDSSPLLAIGIGTILAPYISPIEIPSMDIADKIMMGISCGISCVIISKILSNNSYNYINTNQERSKASEEVVKETYNNSEDNNLESKVA